MPVSTKSGRKAYRAAERARLISRTRARGTKSARRNRSRSSTKSYVYKLKPRPKSEGNVAIYEYFVGMEVLKSSQSDRNKEASEKMLPSTESIETYNYDPED